MSTTDNNYYVHTEGLGTISQPYQTTIAWGNPVPSGPSREEDLSELETLVRLMGMTEHECIEERLHDAVHLKLYQLYPELQDEEYSNSLDELLRWDGKYNETEKVTPIIQKDEPLDDKTADAASGTNYHHWAQALYYLGHIEGCRVARKTWDNTLNMEYVIKSEEMLVKNYLSTSSDYFKEVRHTYKPTKEDIEATDWYII